MLTKRLYCLKCNREAQDNDEYYHCPGCGQYQQVVFYELQEGRRPEQRFEWREVETRQRTENPEPIHNSGRGMLDVIQPLAIREQQKRQEQGPGGAGSMAVYPATVAEDRAQPLRPEREPGECKKRGKAQESATIPGPSKVPSDVQGGATRKASTPPLQKEPQNISEQPKPKEATVPRDRNKTCVICGDEFEDRSKPNARTICYKQECHDAKYPQPKKGGPVVVTEVRDKPTIDPIDYDRLAGAMLEQMGGIDAVTQAIVDGLYRGLTGKYISFEFGGRGRA